MNKNVFLISILSVFLLVTVSYVSGWLDPLLSSNSGSTGWGSSASTGTNSGNVTVPVSPAVVEPSADNVSMSYYQKVTDLEQYLETNPTDTTHILRLARLYAGGHQTEKAIGMYERYKEVNPEQIQTYLELANLYGASSRWDKALNMIEELLKTDPTHGKALYNKAAILANMGDLESARDEWIAIVNTSSDSSIVEMSKSALDRLTVN